MASTILEQILENISRGARLPSMAPRPTPPAHPVAPLPTEKAVEDAGALMREVMEEMDQRLSRMVEQVLTHPALTSSSPAPPTRAAEPIASPLPLQGGTEAIDERRAANLQAEYGSYAESPEFEPIVTESRDSTDTAIADTPVETPPGTGAAYDTFPAAGSIESSVAPVEPMSMGSEVNEDSATNTAAWQADLIQSVAEDASRLDDDEEEDDVSMDDVSLDDLSRNDAPAFDLPPIEEGEGTPEVSSLSEDVSSEVDSPELPIESALSMSAEELEVDEADGFALDLDDLSADSDITDNEITDTDIADTEDAEIDLTDNNVSDLDDTPPTPEISAEIESGSIGGIDAGALEDDDEDDSVASLIGGNEPPGERLLDLVGDVSDASSKEVVSVSTDTNAIEQVEAIVEEIAATCGVGAGDGESDVSESSEADGNPALAEIRDLLVPLQSVPSLLEQQGAPTQQILRQMQVLADEVRELARAPRVVTSTGDDDAPPAEDTKATQRRRVAIDDIQGMIQSLS